MLVSGSKSRKFVRFIVTDNVSLISKLRVFHCISLKLGVHQIDSDAQKNCLVTNFNFGLFFSLPTGSEIVEIKQFIVTDSVSLF